MEDFTIGKLLGLSTKVVDVRAEFWSYGGSRKCRIGSPDGDLIDSVQSHVQSVFDHPELEGQKPLVVPQLGITKADKIDSSDIAEVEVAVADTNEEALSVLRLTSSARPQVMILTPIALEDDANLFDATENETDPSKSRSGNLALRIATNSNLALSLLPLYKSKPNFSKCKMLGRHWF
ncbi:hypothetical protein NE237_012718 [Protea cynaroides]|uniref:Uncharacterized protein n=1 Tax=Protea cynaroides TaxID=273540 RepID=A0A9Q0GYK4_9MAGN|nr:hypothetical protein NE237_012718 [Protea cynaroides]